MRFRRILLAMHRDLRDSRRLRLRARRLGRWITPGHLLHLARWHVAGPAACGRWADRRLELGGYFWLFLLGLNNSGTTLLSRLLAMHPLVRALPDEGFRLTTALRGSGAPARAWALDPGRLRWTEDTDPAPVARLRYDWAYYVPPRPGIILEKTPAHSLRARWFQRHFRPSRFLFLVRSPYAVAEGIRRRAGHPIEEAARHWAQGNAAIADDCVALEHCLRVSYEALTGDPDRELGRIERFLGLDPPIDRALVRRPVSVHNIHGRPRPLEDMNAASLARLSAEDIRTITRIAGPVMRRFGYTPLEPAPARLEA
jgi:hypothetical protein